VLRETTSRGLCGLVCPSRTGVQKVVVVCCLLLQHLIQSCTRGGRRIVCVFITAVPITKLFARGGIVCVFYYCRTYYKAVRVGGGGEWRTCAMRDDEDSGGHVCCVFYCSTVCVLCFLLQELVLLLFITAACVFITAGPITKLFAWGGGGGQWRTCATRDYEPRPVWTSLPITH
jgi:hypothetical protein